MGRNFPALSFLYFSILFATVRGQECNKPTDAEIESLITDSLRDVNGDGGTSADITITLLNSTLVCLASASTENKYHFVSVVAQYTRMDGSDPQFDETSQFEFECDSGSAWRTTGDELGSDSRENKEVAVNASRFSATERTDCFMCIKPGHSQLGVLVGSSPVPDEVHHCLVCSGCNDPQLCYLPIGFTPPARGACCNAYEGGVCVATCSASTVANDRECVTECPTGLYNVSGVCENCTISCENGGTLVSDPNTCECQCGTIYNGSYCSGCKCENGGTCGGNSEQCDCGPDYSGMFCETCNKECQNGGTLNSGDCSCMCVDGFTGDNCGTECTINCENGGTVTSNTDTCECQCGAVYGGSNCSECRCQNGGTCSEQCDCPSGYSGVFCEMCSITCQNGGTLNSVDCSCLCPEGFTGDNCGTSVPDCPSLTDNCKECSGTPLMCTVCEDGYTITREGTCACDPSCRNGGTQDASSCECSCPAGFSGSYCGDKDCPSLTDNCKECSGTPLTCTVCEDGYTLNEKTGICECSIENCLVCSDSVCKECKDGFTLDNDGLKCKEKDKLSPGAIAGIVIGVLLLFLLLLLLITILVVVAVSMALSHKKKSSASGGKLECKEEEEMGMVGASGHGAGEEEDTAAPPDAES